MAMRSFLAHVLRASNAQCRVPATARAIPQLTHVDLDLDRRWSRRFCSASPDDSEPSTSEGASDAVSETAEDPADALEADALEPEFKKGRRWTRAEKGTWADGNLVEQLNDVAVEVPPGIPIYDMRTDLPWHYEPQSKWADMLERVAAADPDMLKMLEMEDYPPPYPGARSILRWETYMVLMAGPEHLSHPVNKKAKCWVYLRDLQQECGLTDAALEHIALICGPRYNPNKGELTLVSEKYPDREENRRDILDTLHALVAEGERAFPQTDSAILKLQEERRVARENQDRGLPAPEYNPLRPMRRVSDGEMEDAGTAKQAA